MIFLYVLFLSMLPSPAMAYIDPGMGSMIVQGLIAAIATGLLFFKLWWLRIKAFFSRKPQDTDKADDQNSKQ